MNIKVSNSYKNTETSKQVLYCQSKANTSQEYAKIQMKAEHTFCANKIYIFSVKSFRLPIKIALKATNLVTKR